MNGLQLTEWQTPSLTEDERVLLNALIAVWSKKRSRNVIRSRYYDAHNKLKDLGIAVPPSLKNVETVVGWPAKAVDALAVRSRFDGFTLLGAEENTTLNTILGDNDFGNLYAEATNSELIHSCSFLTVSKGGEGEPNVLLSAYSAGNSAALWDCRRKRIKAGLCVVDGDDSGFLFSPTWFNFHTDYAVISIKKAGNRRWVTDRMLHPQGRPLMEPMRYRPTLDRPFGQSRISRAVMSITDSAVREAIRSEVVGEFAAAPQKYLLGADDSVFESKTQWEAFIGAILAISKDEDGDIPRFGQLPQLSMQPHTEYMRSLAARFSGETSVPVSSLGVIHDNPSSAEAIYAAKEDLVIEAEALNDRNGAALRNIGLLALAIAQDKTVSELTDEERSLTARFKNPAIPSIVSQADAMVKVAAAAPWITESVVFLEELGFDESQRRQLLSDKRKAEARQLLQVQEPVKEEAMGLSNSKNFYKVSSAVKDYKRGDTTKKFALNMLMSLGFNEEEAIDLLNDNDEVEEENIVVPNDLVGGVE